MNARYLEYVERIERMSEMGVVKNPRIKCFEEWHFDDYKDRVEYYLMDEHGRDILGGECWTDDRTEAEAQNLYDQVCDIIEACYEQKLSVVIPAGQIQKLLSLQN